MARPLPRDRLRAWRRRLLDRLHGEVADRRMADELAFHLSLETEKNIRLGMSPAAARRAAVLAFGGVDRVAEEVRDVRGIAWVDDFVHDLPHAIRSLRRSPGFTLSAVAALSLGLGANSAVFSVVHAVVIARLPFAAPEQLVRVWEANPAQRIEQGRVSPGTFLDLQNRSRTLGPLALFGERDMLFVGDHEPWEAHAAAVSPELFDLLGIQPVAGRGFARDNTGGTVPEIVLGYGVWQRQFGGDPGVVGKTLRMDYKFAYTIVGVMPAGFAFPPRTEVWTPLRYGPAATASERQFRYYGAVARLRPGITLGPAEREASVIAARLAAEYPASNAGWTIQLAPLDRSIVGDTRPVLVVLLCLAGCVLLIACGNVATLAVARATARRHEIAVRMALGAGKARLVRQWTTEALVLAVAGGLGGLIVGYWSNRLLIALAPRDIPRLDEVTFGASVVVFVAVATAVVALAVGIAPALRSRDTQPLDAMRSRTDSASFGGARSRQWLVGTQVALTFVLTVAATLLLRSFARLESTDLGYRRHDILSVRLRVPAGRFLPSPWVGRLAYFDRLIAEVSRIPGVQLVGGTSKIPLTGESGSGSMWRLDAPGAQGAQPPASAADQWKAGIQLVTPRYFETMGIRLTRGRSFEPTDRFTERQLERDDVPRPPGVAIINEAMARRYWPNGDALGARIFLFDDRSFAAYRTIVGVVADARETSADSAASPTVFLPYAQNPGQPLSLVVRSIVPAGNLVGPVTDRLRAIDPVISIGSVQPLDDVFAGAVSRPRFALVLVGSFAALALAIATVGVFGIVGFLVARRRQELGIRMSLGARPAQVVRLVLGEGLRPVLSGIVCGMVGAIVVARAMRALLYGVAPLDVVSFVTAAVLLGGASVVAAAIAARHAASVDPLRALRSE
jgi:putative ABC transport system permease protein